jgi:hypothetical protein
MIHKGTMKPGRLALCCAFGLLLFLFFISVPVICDAEWLTAETYEDCILKNIEKAKTREAVDAVKEACKKKFPQIFDFQQIAKEAGVKDWQEVKINPEYIILTEKEKEEVQSQYFQDIIMPYVNPDFVQEAKLQFYKYVKSFKEIASPNNGVGQTPK